MIQLKLVDGITLNFPELFITKKYLKIKFKKEGHHTIFWDLEVKGSKIILQKLNKRDCFCLHSSFHFYGVSRAKTDLHNKYMI